MTRKDLCLSGGMLLAIGAAVWLWGENRELRGRMAGQINSSTGLGSGATRDKGSGRPKAVDTANRHQNSADKTGNQRRTPESPAEGPQFEKVSTEGSGPVPSGSKELAGNLGTGKQAQGSPGQVDSGKSEKTVVIPVGEAEKSGESLLKNGGFDKELAPWVCKEARVISEPGNPSNSVLEINPQEGTFTLTQKFQRSPASTEALLSLREMGAQDELCPIEISLVRRDGKEWLVYSSMLDTSGKWSEHSMRIPSDPKAVGISIKVSSVKNPVWLDDMVLRDVKSISFAPGE